MPEKEKAIKKVEKEGCSPLPQSSLIKPFDPNKALDSFVPLLEHRFESSDETLDAQLSKIDEELNREDLKESDRIELLRLRNEVVSKKADKTTTETISITVLITGWTLSIAAIVMAGLHKR